MTDHVPEAPDFLKARAAFERMRGLSPDGLVSVEGSGCDCESCLDWRLIGTTLALAEQRIAALQRDARHSIGDISLATITVLKTEGDWWDALAGDEWGPEEQQVVLDVVAAVERVFAHADTLTDRAARSLGAPQEQERT